MAQPKSASAAPKIGTQTTAILSGSLLSGKPAIRPSAHLSQVRSSLICPGAMLSLSTVVIPVFLDTNTNPSASHHLLQQWLRLYSYGHVYMPALCIATCSLYALSALFPDTRTSSRHPKNHWRVYATAGITTIAMVPFTWVVMAPTNNLLFGLEAAAAKVTAASASAPASAVEEEAASAIAELSFVPELVVKWAWLHAARSLFPLVGAIVGFGGVLRELGA